MMIGIGLGLTRPGGRSIDARILAMSSTLAWWDAAYGVSLVSSAVSAWNDRKNGYSATQGVSSARPTYSATGFNGYPVVTGDGTDDELTLAPVPDGIPTGASPSKFLLVVDQLTSAADTAGKSIFSVGNGINTARRVNRVVATGTNRVQALVGTGAANATAQQGTVDFSGRHVVLATFTASGVIIEIDGTATTETAGIPSTANNRLRLFANDVNAAGGFANVGIRHALIGTWTGDELTFIKNWANGQKG